MPLKNKQGINAMLNTLFIIAGITLCLKITNIKIVKDNIPLLLYGISLLAICTWSYGIYSNIQYRKGNADYLYIPTKNDAYYRISSFILGVFALLTGVLCMVFHADVTSLFIAICLLSGLLLFINGLVDVPKGRIEVDDHLNLTGLKDKIGLDQINAITIYPNAIVIENIHNEKLQVNNFDIDRNWGERLTGYLRAKTASVAKLDIRNHVS